MNIYVLDAIACAAALLCIRSWLTWWRRRANGLPLPPGPKGLPIVGNVLDMPEKDQWEAVRQWREKYGDLVYIRIFGTQFLFLNSYETAIELLEKRSNIYSGRHHTTMLDLEGWPEWFTSLLPYGDQLRKSRQHLNKFFHRSATKEYFEIQANASRKLLLKLLEDPDKLHKYVRHWAAETIIKITYGFEVVEDDPLVELIDEGIRAADDATMFSIANALPILRYLPTWFPGAHFHKEAQEGHRLAEAMRSEPFNEAKKRMANGEASPSMLSKLLESNAEKNGSGIDEKSIAESVAVAYGAGGDTTVAALMTFVLAMVLYPDVMRKGQEELDRVIGRNNLPTVEDRPRLPYIEAICAECLRWQTVTAIAVPHLLEKDDVYNGYYIPAGTVVCPNVWAMLRDPVRYPDPERFIPERWLPESGKEPPLDVRKMAFGFGRRICPGRFFAENSVFIAAASILAVFDIQKAIDQHGNPITPKEDFATAIIRHPKPFKCRIMPRSENGITLILNDAAATASLNRNGPLGGV